MKIFKKLNLLAIITRSNFLLLLSLAGLMLSGCNTNELIVAKEGVLDATKWSPSENGVITLNGEWEFYWNQLLVPEDFNSPQPKLHLKLPGVWNDHTYDGKNISGEGYATFRLRIKTQLKNEKLGLRVPFHFTAYKLWINEELVAENGVVGESKQTATAQTLPNYIYFNTPQDDIIITLQVSNFHFDKGGAPAPYKLGLEQQIKETQTRQIAFDLFLTGSLFIMCFYHLGLYILRKKEISTLYFSLVCLLIMIRTICLGETFLIVLYPDFNFELYIKLVFIGYYIGPPLFILFLENLYPEDSIPVLGKIFLALGVLFSLSVLFPANVSSRASVPYSLVFALSLTYELFLIVKACIKKREGAWIALSGLLVLVGTGLNDILFDNQVINTDYYTSQGMLLFIFSQSFLLSLKFSKAFSAVENLSIHIKKINKANNRFVPSEFLSFLGKESVVDVQLGDHITKDMTIFFADIRSFTALSESMTPEENFNFINSLLKRISPIVRNNNGFIDKFMGDSIMALFPSNPSDALLTAAQVLQELELYNESRIRTGFLPIRLGIGINAGSLMLGTIGEEERMEGTVISDAVNLASRLEGLTKIYGANIIVSENVLMEVKDKIQLDYRFLGKVPVKGKADTVAIYDIFSYDSIEIKTIKLQINSKFEKAIHLYQTQSFLEAKGLFESTLEIFPEDKAAQYYLDKIVSNQPVPQKPQAI